MPQRTWSQIPEDEIIEAIEKTAQYLEDDGNQGVYAHSIPENWILKPYFKKHREGILYFSTGHGWRVRKKPHWREVLKQKKDAWRPPTSLNDIPV